MNYVNISDIKPQLIEENCKEAIERGWLVNIGGKYYDNPTQRCIDVMTGKTKFVVAP